MKPAYATVEFWRENRDETATIEGWLTVDFIQTRNVLITPSLDYDEATIKIAIAWDKVISITPAQSVRSYQILGEPIGKGKRPILEAFERMGLIDDLGEDEGRASFYRDVDGNLKAVDDD